MKNITVAVPDDVYKAARVRAAHEGRSVSSLVAEFLESLSSGEDERFARLMAQQERLWESVTDFNGGDRLSRDDLYDRAIR